MYILALYFATLLTQCLSSTRSLLTRSLLQNACTTDADCLNGGQCRTGGNCRCIPGFIGDNCQINEDDCTPNPCLNGGICRDGVNSFSCSCPSEFTGDTCATPVDTSTNTGGGTSTGGGATSVAQTQTDCDCQNGGTCRPDGSCGCVSGFIGDKCEINADDCTPNPCLNGATCNDAVNSFSCNCPTGFTGNLCQTPVDTSTNTGGGTGTSTISRTDCDCQNGGICNSDGSCRCIPGFEGDKCQINIDDCDPNPCQNGGQCRDGINTFDCSCINGFTGDLCEKPPVKPRAPVGCEQNPCKNRGICFPRQDGGILCACPAGYQGNLCQNRVAVNTARDGDGSPESPESPESSDGDGSPESPESPESGDDDDDDDDAMIFSKYNIESENMNYQDHENGTEDDMEFKLGASSWILIICGSVIGFAIFICGLCWYQNRRLEKILNGINGNMMQDNVLEYSKEKVEDV